MRSDRVLLLRLGPGRRLLSTRKGDQYFLTERSETRRLSVAEACSLIARHAPAGDEPEAADVDDDEDDDGPPDPVWDAIVQDVRSREAEPTPPEADPEWDAVMNSFQARAVPFTPPPWIPDRDVFEAMLEWHQFKHLEGDRWIRDDDRRTGRSWLWDACFQQEDPHEQYLAVGRFAAMCPHVLATLKPDGITLAYGEREIPGLTTDAALAAALGELLPLPVTFDLSDETANEDEEGESKKGDGAG